MKLVTEASEQKVQKTVTVMPVLTFTQDMLDDETKYPLTFSDMLELFSVKVEEKIVEESEEESKESQY